jgi:hypothetical protein
VTLTGHASTTPLHRRGFAPADLKAARNSALSAPQSRLAIARASGYSRKRSITRSSDTPPVTEWLSGGSVYRIVTSIVWEMGVT